MPVGPAETSGADTGDTPDQVLLMRRNGWPHAMGLTDLLSIQHFDTRQRRISFTCRGSRLSAIDRPDDGFQFAGRAAQAELRGGAVHYIGHELA